MYSLTCWLHPNKDSWSRRGDGLLFDLSPNSCHIRGITSGEERLLRSDPPPPPLRYPLELYDGTVPLTTEAADGPQSAGGRPCPSLSHRDTSEPESQALTTLKRCPR